MRMEERPIGSAVLAVATAALAAPHKQTRTAAAAALPAAPAALPAPPPTPPTSPQDAASADFPIDCHLSYQRHVGFWHLDGRCRLCTKRFHGSGAVQNGVRRPFHGHAVVQREMVQHAKEMHGLDGNWRSERCLEERDPRKRLVWSRQLQAPQAKETEAAVSSSAPLEERRAGKRKSGAVTGSQEAGAALAALLPAALSTAQAKEASWAKRRKSEVVGGAVLAALPAPPRQEPEDAVLEAWRASKRKSGAVGHTAGSRAAGAVPAALPAPPPQEASPALPPQEALPAPPLQDAESSFPVACKLNYRRHVGFWHLNGRCRLCGKRFHGSGAMQKGVRRPFAGHFAVQQEMLRHAREVHDLQGNWTAVRRLEARDCRQRLVWSRDTARPAWCAGVLRLQKTKVKKPPPKKVVRVAQPQQQAAAPVQTSFVEVCPWGAMPPQESFPEGTVLLRAEEGRGPLLDAETFAATLEEAAGIKASEARHHALPEELKSAGWRSLLILGPSGSGKTTLLRQLLAQRYPDEEDAQLYPETSLEPGTPLIEAFDSAEEGQDLLGSVGLASVPSWCKPIGVLSVGERYRAAVALALQRRKRRPQLPLVCDEWASEVHAELARSISLAVAKRLQREEEGAGPYIFATCREDVADALQPELIVRCSPDAAPCVSRNPHFGAAPVRSAVMRGDPHPHIAGLEQELLMGWWCFEDGSTFNLRLVINASGTALLQVNMPLFMASSHVARLQRADENEAPGEGGFPRPWFQGESCLGQMVRFRVTGRDTLEVQAEGEEPSSMWRQRAHASRVIAPRNSMPQSEMRRKQVLINEVSYEDAGMERLRKLGWYVPPEYGQELYPGLCLQPETWGQEGRYGTKPFGKAAYVCGIDGALPPKVAEVSKLFDYPFDGLSMHCLPCLPPLGDFTLGAILGPSGSGKSSLAERLFGPSPRVRWSSELPVLAHFPSLALAQECLHAACLEPEVAMRPHATLSAGERARANVARLIAAATAGSVGQPVILDEFTSLLDRPVAWRLAQRLQALVRRRLLQVVVICCHSDVVAAGRLEPDWLFECHTWRLLRPQAVQRQVEEALSRMKEEARKAFFSDDFARSFAALAAAELARCRPTPRPELCEEQQPSRGPEPLCLQLEVRRALLCEWQLFKQHHYKSGMLKNSSKAFVGLLEGRAVCFIAIDMVAHNFVREHIGEPWQAPMRRLLFREHRTVVAPDLQGSGLAALLCDCVAAYIHVLGHDFTSQTVHPFYGSYRERSPFWGALPSNRNGDTAAEKKKLMYSHFFRGAMRPDGSECPELKERLGRRVKLELEEQTFRLPEEGE